MHPPSIERQIKISKAFSNLRPPILNAKIAILWIRILEAESAITFNPILAAKNKR